MSLVKSATALDRPRAPRIQVLGVEVDVLTAGDLNSILEDGVAQDRRIVIGYQNLHGVYLTHRDRLLREFYAHSDWILADGMSLIAVARLLGFRVSRDHRVSYLDWLDPLMRCAAAHGWTLYYLGSKPGAAEEGSRILEGRYPGLRMLHHHGYFDAAPGSAENQEILTAIEKTRPQVLLVGMGMPRQEHWVLQHRDRLAANVVLTAGSFIDYVSGMVTSPPRWAGRVGLEWLFRLASEPRRLSGRYLVEPWSLLPLLARDLRSRGRHAPTGPNRDRS